MQELAEDVHTVIAGTLHRDEIDLILSGHDHMYLRTKPVRGEKAMETQTVQDSFKGETLTFLKDPAGTVYALPSTAGTKRYAVNERAMPPILDVAKTAFSTSDLGGCFATVETDGNKLVYKAYCVDDETREVTEVDRFALLKTEERVSTPTKYDTTLVSSIVSYPFNLLTALVKMLFSYVKLLGSVV